MTLLLDAPSDLQGSQQPRHWSVPDFVSSTGEEAVELAALGGLILDPWQTFVLASSLGERPDGKWAAFQVGLVVPRQNGKGGLLEARELTGLFLLGERLIIHSAHQFDTSLEAFRRLLFIIENTPDFDRRVKRVSRAHGEEGIELKNGQRIRFRTRTSGGGRGFTGDCVILDEAMIIPAAAHSALFPTLSARPNPQIWYTGSAVDQDVHEHGLVLAGLVERGRKGGDPSLAYFEWSAADDLSELTQEQLDDLADEPEAWAQANPALGIRISTEYVENERRALTENAGRGFFVERLGIGSWPRTDGGGVHIIDPEDWLACVDDESYPEDPICFAFDVTPDRSAAAIAAAGDRSDRRPHVEVVDHRRGTGWVVDRLAQLVSDHKTYAIYCDPSGPAGSLVAEIEPLAGKTPGGDSRLIVVSAKEHAQACGVFFDDVFERRLRHLGTAELNEAVDGAAKRPLGEAWAWSRKNSTVDISPLVACTLANWGNHGRPRRASRVINLNDV